MLVKLAVISLKMKIMEFIPEHINVIALNKFLKYSRTDNSASLKIKMHEDRYWQNKVTLLLRWMRTLSGEPTLPYHFSSFLKGVNSRWEDPQKLTQSSPRSHPRHLVGKRTAQIDAIKDITSDSQVDSYFPYRWSPASLTLNIYFYRFLYLYITRITINNDTPHLKSPKNENRRATLGRPAMKLSGGFN